jgi:WD40 repeat protein
MDYEKNLNEEIVDLDNGLTPPFKYICSVSFDRNGEALAVGTSDKIVQIYDVER